jgi:IS5 family transposase
MTKRSAPPKQLSFASYEFSRKKRVTRRERFLGEMEAVVPWVRLEAVIEPLCPSTGRGGGRERGCPRPRGDQVRIWLDRICAHNASSLAAITIAGSVILRRLRIRRIRRLRAVSEQAEQ